MSDYPKNNAILKWINLQGGRRIDISFPFAYIIFPVIWCPIHISDSAAQEILSTFQKTLKSTICSCWRQKIANFLIIKIALQRSVLETSGRGVILKNKSKTASLKKRETLIQIYWRADYERGNVGIYRYWEVLGFGFYHWPSG